MDTKATPTEPIILQSLETRYGLQPLQFVRSVEEGVLSDNIVVRERERLLFFKTYNQKYENTWIETVHRVKQLFADNDIPVILPLTNREHTTLFEESGRIHALFPFVEGKHVTRGNISPTALRSMGTILGKIHRIGSQKISFEVQEQTMDWNMQKNLDTVTEILAIIEQKPTLDAFDTQALPYLRAQLAYMQELTQVAPSFDFNADHLIHGDYHDANLFFNKDDTVKHVFDWEKTRISDRRHELLRAISLSIFNGTYSDDRFEQATHFLKAYTEQYPITPDSLAKAWEWFSYLQVRGTWLISEHYLKHNTRADKYLQSSIATFDYVSKHRNEFQERLATAIR